MKIVIWVRRPDTILDKKQQPQFAGKKLSRTVFILMKMLKEKKNDKNNDMLILQVVCLDEDAGASDRMHKILWQNWIIIDYFASAM